MQDKPIDDSKYMIAGGTGEESEDATYEESNDIVLFGGVSGKEFIRFTDEGMVYLGGLVKDEGIAYKRFSRWLDLAEKTLETDAQEELENKEFIKPIPVQLRAEKIVIQSSADGRTDSEWLSLMPYDVPDWVKDPKAMADMMEGTVLSWNGDATSRRYRASRAIEQIH